MRPAQANLLLLACAVIWGLSFLFQKTAMDHVAPFQFVAARCLLAAVVLIPFAIMEVRRSGTADVRALAQWSVVAGTVLLAAAYLQQLGIVTASVTSAAFLTSLYVIVAPLLAWAMLGQRPDRLVVAAVALSAAGAWLLGGGGPTTFGIGDAVVILATFFWALHLILLGRAAPVGHPIAFTAGQFAVGAIIALVGAAAFEEVEPARLGKAWFEIFYVGVLAGALTFALFTIALRYTTAASAAIIISTEAPFAAVGAYFYMGERLGFAGMAGASLMVAAALLAQMPAMRRRPEALVRPDRR